MVIYYNHMCHICARGFSDSKTNFKAVIDKISIYEISKILHTYEKPQILKYNWTFIRGALEY